MTAWQYQTALKKEKIPNPNELLNKINSSDSCLRDKALVSILYLLAARISEVLPEPYLRKVKYKKVLINGILKAEKDNRGKLIIESIERKPLNYKGLCKQDISFGKLGDGGRYLLFNIQNRKNKHKLRKEVPIIESIDKGFVEIIERYLQTLTWEQPLFKFSKVWSWKIVHRIVGCNPHFLRDIRLTHLVVLFHRDGSRLQKYAGWSDLRPASSYVQLSWQDIWS